jgi:hypothetical protein
LAKAHRPFVPLGEQECLCHWIRPATAWRLAAHICMSTGSFLPTECFWSLIVTFASSYKNG